jgi:hypothetical protein
LWVPADRTIRLGSQVAEGRATTAIHHAVHIVLGLADAINEINILGLHVPTEELWQTLRAIEGEKEASS